VCNRNDGVVGNICFLYLSQLYDPGDGGSKLLKMLSFPFEFQPKNEVQFVEICVVQSALCKEMSKVRHHNLILMFIYSESYVS
jgi:hypothetical protein